MTPEQRAVMFGPASAPRTEACRLDIDESGTVSVAKPSERRRGGSLRGQQLAPIAAG